MAVTYTVYQELIHAYGQPNKRDGSGGLSQHLHAL
ncbi:hypothetical protein GCWB2_06415 [Gordonia rubripertincta]|nr:hypothetical protein GCWB2_06415 [Gordonia rubripertincta]